MGQDKEIKFWGKLKNIVGLTTEEEAATQAHHSRPSTSAGIEELSAAGPDLFAPPPTEGRSSGGSSMVVMEPKTFEDALGIVKELKQNKTVIINLHLLSSEAAQRIVDFVSGATHALEGNQERISESIFLFAPASVSISSASTWVHRMKNEESSWEIKL